MRIIGRGLQRGLDVTPAVGLGVFHPRIELQLLEQRAHGGRRHRLVDTQHVDLAVQVVRRLHIGAGGCAQSDGALLDRRQLRGRHTLIAPFDDDLVGGGGVDVAQEHHAVGGRDHAGPGRRGNPTPCRQQGGCKPGFRIEALDHRTDRSSLKRTAGAPRRGVRFAGPLGALCRRLASMSSAVPIEAAAEPGPATEHERTASPKDALKHAFLDNLYYMQGKFATLATPHDYYLALAYAVRDRMLQRWISTASTYTENGSRTVAYLSAEFLIGPHLGNNLINLDIYDVAREAMAELGLDLEELLRQEDEPGLGNGGLGRLAACFIDSLATLQVPCVGYGIRYEYGIFQQEIIDGWQVERTDKWLRFGNPVGARCGPSGRWRSSSAATPSATGRAGAPAGALGAGPRGGQPCRTTRRSWAIASTRPTRCGCGAPRRPSRSISRCSTAATTGAPCSQKVTSENITKVLYPNDDQVQGKELRLEQQFFFVCASLQDMLRIIARAAAFRPSASTRSLRFSSTTRIPSIAVAELMRLLVDELAWTGIAPGPSRAATFGYTNHTLLPEALERWPVDLFGRLLPRHLEIIYEINARFLDEVRIAFFGDEQRLQRMSLIDESGERYVRMAHLATVGSHAINGVASLHSRAAQERRAARFLRALAGEVQQPDQRRDAAPLDGAGQSAPGAASSRARSARTGCAISTSCAASSR